MKRNTPVRIQATQTAPFATAPQHTQTDGVATVFQTTQTTTVVVSTAQAQVQTERVTCVKHVQTELCQNDLDQLAAQLTRVTQQRDEANTKNETLTHLEEQGTNVRLLKSQCDTTFAM